jgi:intraflagellar transport protein 88
MEKEIHALIEESASLLDTDPYLSLDRAKQATKKVAALEKFCDEQDITTVQDSNLDFATWFHLASIYERNGMTQEAIETYNFLMKQKRPKEFLVRIRINLGNLYHSQNEYTEAIKNYRMALDQTTREEKLLRFQIHRAIGNILMETGKLRSAILEYEAVSMNADADIDTCFNLLLCYAQVRDLEKCKNIFLRILSLKPVTDASSSIDKDLMASISSSDIDLYEDMTRLQKESRTLVFTSARILCSMFNHNEREAGFLWVHKQLDRRYKDIAHQIEIEKALTHMRNCEFDIAIKIFKSFEIKDVDMRAMIATNLSFVYFSEGNFDTADEYADVALATNRFNPNALVNKGNCFFALDDFISAKELYIEALGIDSTHFEALYNLGLTNTRMGLIVDAKVAFEKLHNIITNDPRVLYHVANMYEQSDNNHAAMKWFNVLCACLPTDPGVLHRIGNLYVVLKDDSQSLHYHLESYRIYPTNLDVIGWLAIWFIKHEMYEKSIEFFRQASDIDPKEVKWKLMIGSCYRKIGRLDDALDVYEEVRNDHPRDIECKFRLFSTNFSLIVLYILRDITHYQSTCIGLKYLLSVCRDLGRDCSHYEEEMNHLLKTSTTTD